MGSEIQPLPGDDDYLMRSTILADPRQRRVLSILLDQSHPMTDRDLAVQLAAREAGTPSDVTEKDHQPIRVDLHHRCLPKLEAVGWIERHPEGVVAAEQLSFGDTDLSVADLRDPDHPSWEAVAALLARPRRQDLVSIIAGQRRPFALEELATELASRGYPSWTTDEGRDESTLRSMLHHVDLPRLAAVGLIEYDRDEKTITCNRSLMTLVNRTGLDIRWMKGTDTD